MAEGSAYIRYIHKEPPHGVLEHEHLHSDVLLRYWPHKTHIPDSMTVITKENNQEVERLLNDKIETIYDNKRDVENPTQKFIVPNWRPKYEETLHRIWDTAIDYNPNKTPLIPDVILY